MPTPHTLPALASRGRARLTDRSHALAAPQVSWGTLLSDARRNWPTVGRVFGTGSAYWPGLSSRWYIIYAPPAVRYLFRLLTPLISESNRAKVAFFKGSPPELAAVLGGDDAVQRMLCCSPHILPESASKDRY